MSAIWLYPALPLLLAGCASGADRRAVFPAPLSNEVVRAERKACRAVGMEPELVMDNGRVVWVTCVEPKEK